jgi:hypothetical protein
MSSPNNVNSVYHEGAVELALAAFQSGQFQSQKAAADAFNVRTRTLNRRVQGIAARLDCTPNNQKLTATEEQKITQYILDLDSREFAPRLCEVADMADKPLGVRGGEPVGKHWAERFMTRSDQLNIAFNRAKDRQKMLQEDPEIISAWFKLVKDTKAKYGIHDDDVHNFDETGFQMGVIGSIKSCYGFRETCLSKIYSARRP